MLHYLPRYYPTIKPGIQSLLYEKILRFLSIACSLGAYSDVTPHSLTKFHAQGQEKIHMFKKRKKIKRSRKKFSQRPDKHSKKIVFENELTKKLLSFIFKRQKPASINDIFAGISEYVIDKNELKTEIGKLLNSGHLISTGKKHYQLNDKSNIFSGKLEKNPRGFGFVVDLQPRKSKHTFTKDPFLSVSRIVTANHGDTLLIRILRVRKDGRPEAEVIAILDRNKERLSGFFKNSDPSYVIPEDPRLPDKIRLVETPPKDIPDGDVVIVQILPMPYKNGYQGNLFGKIVDVLGPPQNIDVQMRMVIEKHNLQFIFSAEAIKEAEKFTADPSDISDRKDLRSIKHITIDGETAKDFDDAIAVEKTRNGYRLYVSIADVSYFVKPNSGLDKDAYIRGTSIYFPGRVVPMLPEKLSNNLCSLVPLEDRLTFTAILDFDREGNSTSQKFCKSIIKSKHRFTYTTVKNILIDKDRETRRNHKDFLTPLKWAGELATALHNKRKKRGSIGFNIPEAEIILEDDGNIKTIKRAGRNFAHQIIEEFMLAANEAVAEFFTINRQEAIYRIHEKPTTEKVQEFTSFAQTLGLALPPTNDDPSWFGKVLEIVKDSPTEYVVNNLLLRTMQQARYDTVNQGHFGLAATDYTHFTSPIRRYPDLLVHRTLEAMLLNKRIGKKNQKIGLQEQASFLSSRERVAITAERDMNDRLKMFFMEKFVGESFNAIISGVNESALFIELLDIFISGSIDISQLKGDYYLYDPKRYRLIGEISGKSYQLGNPLKVTLININHQRKRINFMPALTEVED